MPLLAHAAPARPNAAKCASRSRETPVGPSTTSAVSRNSNVAAYAAGPRTCASTTGASTAVRCAQAMSSVRTNAAAEPAAVPEPAAGKMRTALAKPASPARTSPVPATQPAKRCTIPGPSAPTCRSTPAPVRSSREPAAQGAIRRSKLRVPTLANTPAVRPKPDRRNSAVAPILTTSARAAPAAPHGCGVGGDKSV